MNYLIKFGPAVDCVGNCFRSTKLQYGEISQFGYAVFMQRWVVHRLMGVYSEDGTTERSSCKQPMRNICAQTQTSGI